MPYPAKRHNKGKSVYTYKEKKYILKRKTVCIRIKMNRMV